MSPSHSNIDTSPGAASAADVEVQASDEAAGMHSALVLAEQSAASAREAQLRALAELDNVRKRAQRDIESAQRYALERFAAELLPARDSLELATQSLAQADAAGLIAGQQATLQLLDKAFVKFSIVRFDPHGAVFDPSLHEAVVAQDSTSVAPGVVLQVLQSGYQLNGRLLRPARVIVARAPAVAAPDA